MFAVRPDGAVTDGAPVDRWAKYTSRPDFRQPHPLFACKGTDRHYRHQPVLVARKMIVPP